MPNPPPWTTPDASSGHTIWICVLWTALKRHWRRWTPGSPTCCCWTTTSGATAYATFVHTRLPLVDPYRMTGPLADNPWQHTAIPILLVSGGPPVTIPGFVAPHLHRVAHFVPKPVEPNCLLPLVNKLLPEPKPGLVLDLDHGWVEVQGSQIHGVRTRHGSAGNPGAASSQTSHRSPAGTTHARRTGCSHQ